MKNRIFILMLIAIKTFGLQLQAQTSFMVISDPHVFETSLFDNGTAFQSSYENEPRLVEESQRLFDRAIAITKKASPTMLLISGDLTNEGEKRSHEYVKNKLEGLVDRGIKVYVIPGNHDIDNPYAYSYSGDNKSRTEGITYEEFATIYARCGYQDAVMRQGLSYMAYPTDDLALICLDSTIPNENKTRNSDGALTDATLTWAEQAAKKAQNEGRYIIGMMHHEVMEHFDSHLVIASTSVTNSLSNYPSLATVQSRLIRAGINVMFTGHFHIQSIQHVTTTDGELHDISTGSLCTYASPIRKGQISTDGQLSLTVENIDLYYNEEKAHNQYVVEGAIAKLANQMYPKIAEKKEELLGSFPSFLVNMLNIPSSAEEMTTDMCRYMVPAFTDLVNTLSAGDEEKYNPEQKLNACLSAYDDYFKYLCGNMSFIVSLAKDMMAEAGLDLRDQLEAICRSVFYNYVGEATNVVPDNAITLQLTRNIPLLGDLNDDNHVDISDATLLVNIILGTATDTNGTADLNQDGFVNISDVTTLVNIILGK
ncbi:MAG: metallophosphoesterase [Bacteroidaceae bacterium]|nr:metallophosphoesterase [Bacteroidaceae bacterium]